MTVHMLGALVFCILMIVIGLLTWFRIDRFVDLDILDNRLRPDGQNPSVVWRERLRYLGLVCVILGIVALIIVFSGRVDLR
jgi:uncharacterized iron-regulated membrane protein